MKPFYPSLICFFLALLAAPLAKAQESCLLLPAPLQERAAQASLVIEGKVIRQQSQWDRQHHNIYTANLVEVYKVFKGQVPAGGQLEVITEGGQVGLQLQVLSGTLRLQTGEQGIFFLEASGFPVEARFLQTQPSYGVYASSQGFIRYGLPFEEATEPFHTYPSIETDLYPALRQLPGLRQQQLRLNPELQQARQRSGSSFHPAARTLATPSISGFSPQVISAGTGAVLTIRGLHFGDQRGAGFVEFRNANDGGGSFIRPQPSDYVSWTDTTIQVRVPSAAQGGGVAGSGVLRVTNAEGSSQASPGILTVEFALSNILRGEVPYAPNHVDKNGAGGYTFSFAAGFPAAARQAFSGAMDQWSCQTAINWVLGPDVPAATPVAEDGLNVVRFSPAGNNGGQIPANILGRTTTRYQGCEISGSVRYYVNELDFEFNSSIGWQFGPAAPSALQYDFYSVVLHEQGHAHQLSHLILPRAVMHYSVARGQVSRQLNGRSEVDGGTFVTQLSFRSNTCGPARMTPRVPESCSQPGPLLSFQAAGQPDGSSLLSWTAQQEGGIQGYEVQRSSNGFHWLPLGQVSVSGGSYSFTDPRPFGGITYYRLRLLQPGSPAYSALRQTGSEAGQQAFLQLYPNPVQEQLSFEYHAPAAGQVVVRIFDTAGRQHGVVARRIAAGNNPFLFDTSRLARGLYLLQTESGQDVRQTRFVKL
ncbi:MAG: T9SS type A sorting domain-containing protein [Adhaeribacter sp.]